MSARTGRRAGAGTRRPPFPRAGHPPRPDHVLVFDVATLPLSSGTAQCVPSDGGPVDAPGRAASLDCAIVCIGALIAQREGAGWRVRALGAPHVGERDEARLIGDFAARLTALRPLLVHFGGHGDGLGRLRVRAMVHRLVAPGLARPPGPPRPGGAVLDLRASLDGGTGGHTDLDGLCRAMRLPGQAPNAGGRREVGEREREPLDAIAAEQRWRVGAVYRLFLAHERMLGHLARGDALSSGADLDRALARSWGGAGESTPQFAGR